MNIYEVEMSIKYHSSVGGRVSGEILATESIAAVSFTHAIANYSHLALKAASKVVLGWNGRVPIGEIVLDKAEVVQVVLKAEDVYVADGAYVVAE